MTKNDLLYSSIDQLLEILYKEKKYLEESDIQNILDISKNKQTIASQFECEIEKLSSEVADNSLLLSDYKGKIADLQKISRENGLKSNAILAGLQAAHKKILNSLDNEQNLRLYSEEGLNVSVDVGHTQNVHHV